MGYLAGEAHMSGDCWAPTCEACYLDAWEGRDDDD